MNLDKTEEFNVIVEGVPVTVLLDEKGKPLIVSSGYWASGDAERIARLALGYACTKFEQAAVRRTKAARDATRTALSTKRKREAAAEFWGNEWLEAAHLAHPRYGAERLAQAARKLLDMNQPETSKEKRGEITEYRAVQFLHTARAK